MINIVTDQLLQEELSMFLDCARVGVERQQPLLTKYLNVYAPHTASDSKVLTLPSRGGTVSTNRERRKARHWRVNQLLWTDGVHQLKRQFRRKDRVQEQSDLF